MGDLQRDDTIGDLEIFRGIFDKQRGGNIVADELLLIQDKNKL